MKFSCAREKGGGLVSSTWTNPRAQRETSVFSQGNPVLEGETHNSMAWRFRVHRAEETATTHGLDRSYARHRRGSWRQTALETALGRGRQRAGGRADPSARGRTAASSTSHRRQGGTASPFPWAAGKPPAGLLCHLQSQTTSAPSRSAPTPSGLGNSRSPERTISFQLPQHRGQKRSGQLARATGPRGPRCQSVSGPGGCGWSLASLSPVWQAPQRQPGPCRPPLPEFRGLGHPKGWRPAGGLRPVRSWGGRLGGKSQGR